MINLKTKPRFHPKYSVRCENIYQTDLKNISINIDANTELLYLSYTYLNGKYKAEVIDISIEKLESDIRPILIIDINNIKEIVE